MTVVVRELVEVCSCLSGTDKSGSFEIYAGIETIKNKDNVIPTYVRSSVRLIILTPSIDKINVYKHSKIAMSTDNRKSVVDLELCIPDKHIRVYFSF